MLLLNMRPLILFTLLFLSLSACKTSKDSKAEQNKVQEQQSDMNETEHPFAKIDPELYGGESDAFTIKSHRLEGDILSLTVTYSGGCQEHTFELASNGAYAKSLPPQCRLRLIHDGNDDNCRSLIETKLKFNVKDLQYPGTKELVLFVEGIDDRIVYTY